MKACLVSASELYTLRNLVLRPGKPLHTTFYEKDNDIDTFHLAIFLESKAQCIGTFYPEKLEGVYSQRPYRLRGMATHPDFRRKGLGKDLIKYAFTCLNQQQADILWCKARLGAVPFYYFLGFQIIGEQYEIEGIGPHYTMYKLLA
mgnify:CR=1 FL=1